MLLVHFAYHGIPGDYGEFQWAPTLGGECYCYRWANELEDEEKVSMGTHPWG